MRGRPLLIILLVASLLAPAAWAEVSHPADEIRGGVFGGDFGIENYTFPGTVNFTNISFVGQNIVITGFSADELLGGFGANNVTLPTQWAIKRYVDSQIFGGSTGWLTSEGLVRLANATDTVNATTLYVDNVAERVGIGTSSPSSTLHVSGTFQLASGTSVNEISTATSLGGGSPSDDVIPTQAAIKSYVDSQMGGAITEVIAGAGLTGGGSSGSVTLDVGAGTGISTSGTQVSFDTSWGDARYYTQTAADSAFAARQSNTASLATGWYRIAVNGNPEGSSGGSRAHALFTVRDTQSGHHSSTSFYASIHYGRQPTLSLLSRSWYGATGGCIKKVRILDAGTYDGSAVEIYVEAATTCNVQYTIYDNEQSTGWTPVNWDAGNVPGGFGTTQLDLDTHNPVMAMAANRNDNAYLLQRDGSIVSGGSLSVGGVFELASGTSVNEISAATNLGGGSPSDSTLPTQLAVKSYVDSQFAGGAGGWTSSGGVVRLTTPGDDVNATTLYIDNTLGRVGIGTDSPSQALEVVGNLRLTNQTLSPESVTFDSETSTGLRLTNQHGYISLTPLNTNWAHIYTDRPRFIFNQEVQIIGGRIAAYNNANLTFGTSTTEDRMRIRGDTGDVGIGTASPGTRLDVDGEIRARTGLFGRSALFTDENTANSFRLMPDDTGGLNIGYRSFHRSTALSFGAFLGPIPGDGDIWTTGNLRYATTATSNSYRPGSFGYSANGGRFEWYVAPLSRDVNPSVGDSISWTRIMQLNNYGQLNIAGNLQTDGTTRITSTGTLQNVVADAGIITTGTLAVQHGGTGATSFNAGRLLFGAGTGAINTNANLVWDNAQGRLGVGAASPSHDLHVAGTLRATDGAIINTQYISGSIYNAANGILITTDIQTTDNRMIELSIDGHSYSQWGPISGKVQAYNYVPTGTIIQTSYVAQGIAPSSVRVFHHDGVVKFWMEQTGSFQTYRFRLGTNTGHHTITAIQNSVMPGSGVTNEVVITPKTVFNTSVGIGVTDPNAELEVAGDIELSGKIEHTTAGVVQEFANGCTMTANATGLYWNC